jgi:hypothetical protein
LSSPVLCDEVEATVSELSHGGWSAPIFELRRIVELHGGTVHAESPGPGSGAEFVTADVSGINDAELSV